MYVGKKIKHLRSKLNFSQAEFAGEIGVSQAYYSGIESGKKKISKKLIEKITSKWNVSPKYFSEATDLTLPKELGGKIGGVIGGYNTLGKDNLFIFFDDLRKDEPELDKLLVMFQRMENNCIEINDIYRKNFHSAFNDLYFIKADNYADFKVKAINHLKLFLKYEKAIEPLFKAMEKFLKTDFPRVKS
ncbi:MAG TPA: hypothetical protein DGG95_00375 [Cytophagales bacterium]|jgi:transcriptional regulator with XRE-family HTH domain|nr:hypothetical protein [Cytophagales bacterium]